MIEARELKKNLRRQCGCSTRHMVVLDKYYSPISVSQVRALMKDYEKAAYIPEIWDCDDIARDYVNFTARDFLNFVKKTTKEVLGKNVAFGMLVLRDHAQEVFVEENKNLSRRKNYTVYYMDHRDWRIYRPNTRPKWIVT
jgi:hypothetical protein